MPSTKLDKIKHYEGLYGDLNVERNNDYIFLEMIETRSEGFDWIIEEHIHSHLYQFFFIKSGSVEFQSPTTQQKLATPCILVIPPNTLHGLKYSSDVKGDILTISDSIVENICQATPSIMVCFQNLQSVIFGTYTDPIYEKISSLLIGINDELFSTRPEKVAFLNTTFLQLFIYLFRVVETDVTTAIDDSNATLKHFRNFQLSIKKSDTPRSIPSFAKDLGISTVHLNRICQQVSGKTALMLVQEHKIEQARNYLKHTSYSVAELAYRLDFEYPNYFAKLFKKITGLTPTAYRNKVKRSTS